MFRRLLLDDAATLFTLVAFITAFTIYAAATWRTLRMKRPQADRFARLPFDTATPPAAAATGRQSPGRAGAPGFPPAATPAP